MAHARNTFDVMPNDPTRTLIAAAEERGIVSASQREALVRLHDELSAGSPSRIEAARGFNWVSVAYGVGALFVVFAFAWFLADRWSALGPWGVLGVALVYVALLLGCHAWLERHGFALAASVALTLAVGLTPVIAWSLQVVTGLWHVNTRSEWLGGQDVWIAVCWLVVDLATMLAALVAFRWRPGVTLTAPMTVALWGMSFHLARAIGFEYLVGSFDRWLFLSHGLLVCLVAGEVDRWQVRERARGRALPGDLAFCFWFGGLFASAIAYLSIWGQSGPWRHSLAVVAVVLIALSLLLRRRTLLVYGLLALFGYLAYLAFDVFRAYLPLPAILATLGILLILTTVWVQRRFPTLVARVNAERGGAELPPMVTRGPYIVALGIALLSLADVGDELKQREFRRRLENMRLHSGSARDQRPPVRTPAPARPVR